MGIDIHIHDMYLAIAHGPAAVMIAALVILAGLFGAWKLTHVLWIALVS